MTHMLSVFACIAVLAATSHAFAEPLTAQGKTARITAATPAPTRFVVNDTAIIDARINKPVFFRGMGYSPYLSGETPLFGAPPR